MIAATHADPSIAIRDLSDDLLKRSLSSTGSVLSGRNPYSKAWSRAVSAHPELRSWVAEYGIAALAELQVRNLRVRKAPSVNDLRAHVGPAPSIVNAPAPRGAETWAGLLAKTFKRRGGTWTNRPIPAWAGTTSTQPAPSPMPVGPVVSVTVTSLVASYNREERVELKCGATVDMAALQARYAHLDAFKRDGGQDGAIRDGKLPKLTVTRGFGSRTYRGTSWVHLHKTAYRVGTVNRPTEGMLHEIIIHELAHLCRDTHERKLSGRRYVRDVHGRAFQRVLFAAVREAFPGIDLTGVASIRGCYPKDWEIARRIDAWLVADATRSAACRG